MSRYLSLLLPLLWLPAHAAAETHCGNGPSSIPDGTGAIVSWTVDVPDDGQSRVVTSTQVMLQVSHPWIGDLTCLLIAPDGTTVQLFDRPGMPDGGWIGPWGCGGDDIDCMFDDTADAAAEDTCSLDMIPVLSGNLRPGEPLSGFTGGTPAGEWTMHVVDHSSIDAGTIDQFCLTLETAPDCNGNGIPDATDIEGGTSEDVDGNGVPDECDCPSDVDGNGMVDITDLLAIIANWNCTTGCPGDVNADGTIDVADLLLVISSWGECN